MNQNASSGLFQAQWYVMKGENQFGPFNYVDVLRMRQENVLFDFDFVWAQGMSSWTILNNVPNFHSNNVQQFIQEYGELASTILQKRKNKRITKKVSLLITNGENAWRGTTLTLSIAGASLLTNYSKFLPDDQLQIHFHNDDNPDQSFNVTAIIIGKKYQSEVVKENTIMTYFLRFTEISSGGQDVLQKWIEEESNGGTR